jgi:hypothetical protein
MSLLIRVGVSYVSNFEKVELILVEESKQAVGVISGLLGEPDP